MKDHVCLAAVTGSHGVRGDVRLKSFCAEPSAVGDYGPLTDDAGRTYKVTILKPIKGGYSARLSGVTNKDQADALRGQKLWAARDALPSLPDDEFYYTDLIGMTALDTGGADLGRVHAVYNHGAGDLLELRIGGDTVLIPFTKEAVPTVDMATRRIVIDPPAGLMPGDKSDDKDDD